MEPHADQQVTDARAGRPKCGAHGRQKNRPCDHPAGFRTSHPGVGRCYLHGGASLVKHGRYSETVKALAKEKYQQFYEALRDEKDIANLRDEIALTRTLLAAIPDLIPTKNPVEAYQQTVALVQTAEVISRLVLRKAQIETAQSVKLTPTVMEQFVTTIEGIIARYLTGEQFASFRRDLSNLRSQIYPPGILAPLPPRTPGENAAEADDEEDTPSSVVVDDCRTHGQTQE